MTFEGDEGLKEGCGHRRCNQHLDRSSLRRLGKSANRSVFPSPPGGNWLAGPDGRMSITCNLHLQEIVAVLVHCMPQCACFSLFCIVASHASQAALTLLPLDEKTPGWAAGMTRFSLRHAIQYNSLELRIEDEKALRPGRPYVVGEWPPERLTSLPNFSATRES